MPSIFLLHDKTTLIEMTEQPYESENLLQVLLAEHPGILAGDQFHGDEPKRWLLIRREAGIPGEDAGNNRWSLDHLFVDQHGIPTLVEVKRSSDTRLRREVVGQMFDYAANAVVYWPEGEIRSGYEKNCNSAGVDPDQQLAEFLQFPVEPADAKVSIARFWSDVETNLRAGRIRLVFVADVVPPELRRIVEFLNVQMNPAEVLAIEIRQFAGSGATTLVPTVIGQTARAAALKGSIVRNSKQWDAKSFFEALTERKGEKLSRTIEALLAWSSTLLPLTYWGKGSVDGSCSPGLTRHKIIQYPFSVWTSGNALINFEYLKRSVPFDLEANRLELLGLLNVIPGVSFGIDAISRRPSFDLSLLENPEAFHHFQNAIQWTVGKLMAA